ncbi:MAG: Nramp family divalent metal transporter [Crocinitomicaceae bacterium]
MKKRNLFKNIGPGTLVAAAFIGPGTVTVCTISGASFGFTLLWAVLLSIVATIVLQEMAARLGLIYGHGLAEAVKSQVPNKWLKWAVVGLMLAAILIGNSAYEAGNISGGVLGLEIIWPNSEIIFGNIRVNYLVLFLGALAFVILFIGNYKFLEKVLISLVLLMSLSFISAAILTNPNWLEVLKGLFIPNQPEGSLLTIIGLVGTTVVPYNLFLHSALIREKWTAHTDLRKAQNDTIISIVLGGFVSMAIVISAAAINSGEITNGSDLAKGLVPLFGINAKYFLGAGLFAAGITSAITAPIAAAYVAKGCFGWTGNIKSRPFRFVWMLVLGIGVVTASLNFKSVEIIRFAQIANGLLLPIIAIFLWYILNQSKIVGQHKNSIWQNILTAAIILITVILSAKTFYNIFF